MKNKGQYFDDQFRRGVASLSRTEIIDEVTRHPRVAPHNAMATPPEPRQPQFVIVDSLRRQLERSITIEHGPGDQLVVLLWMDTLPTVQLGTFDDIVDATAHKQAVVDGIVQAAKRSAQIDERRAA